MIRTKEELVVRSVQEVYDRYMWLRSKLLTRYNYYWDEAKWTVEGCIECNAWYDRMKTYLDKRFWREFTKAVEKAKEVTV